MSSSEQELPYIAGPVAGFEPGERCRFDPRGAACRRQALEERQDDIRKIATAPQWGQNQPGGANAIIEILPEATGRDEVLQVAVGRTDEALLRRTRTRPFNEPRTVAAVAFNLAQRIEASALDKLDDTHTVDRHAIDNSLAHADLRSPERRSVPGADARKIGLGLGL